MLGSDFFAVRTPRVGARIARIREKMKPQIPAVHKMLTNEGLLTRAVFRAFDGFHFLLNSCRAQYGELSAASTSIPCYVVAADFFLLVVAFISDISLLTESMFSRFQIASFSFFWALVDKTPSANAANFSSIS